MVQLPWLSIPRFAQPGRPHAFANREEALAALYRQIVHAGNTVRQGSRHIRQRVVVTGYVGAGKSALILQALYMLRGENPGAPGQRIRPAVFLPEPLDAQRWLVFHTSGKNVADIDALTDELRKQADTASGETTPARDPYAGLFETIQEQAEAQLPPPPRLQLLHRLFQREPDLYHQVRAALARLAEDIETHRTFAGGTRLDQRKLLGGSERGAEARLKLDAEAAGGLAQPHSARLSGQSGLALSTKATRSQTMLTELERRSRVGSEALVVALNQFFAETRRAQIPTLLVLDDFDEVASSVGPSHQDRSRILSAILGPLTRLEPTLLILGLRQEYLLDDIHRQYEVIHLPALERRWLGEGLAAWAEIHEPALSREQLEVLCQRADRFLARFGEDEPCIMPFPFLQLVTWLGNQVWDVQKSEDELVLRYIEDHRSPEARQLVERIAQRMPAEHVPLCARAAPLDAAPYGLGERDIRVLQQAGLFRWSMAGDPDDQQIVLDPLCAYLCALRQPA